MRARIHQFPFTAYRRSARAGLAAATAAAVLAGWGAAAVAATAPAMTLSSISGPSGGGNPITATVVATAGNPVPFPPNNDPVVQFQYFGTGHNVCGPTAKDIAPITATGTTTTGGVVTVDPQQVLWLSTTKLAFTVPSSAYPSPSNVNATGLALQAGQTTAKWNVCVYDTDSTTTSLLLGTATYTLSLRPEITGVTPASSPARGGQTVIVTGAGFTSGSTATLGGAALTNIKVGAAGTTLTATVPAHAAETGLPLIINTAGGTVSSADPDNNGLPDDGDGLTTADAAILYSYTNGIVISPNHAPMDSTVGLDVRGVGFSALTFDATGSAVDSNAHVFLVRDAYDPADNRGVQECLDVVAVNDTELLCTLNLAAERLDITDSTPVADEYVTEGSYTLTVVATGETTATLQDAAPSIISTGSVFVVGPY